MSQPGWPASLLLIGCGNMGGAMLSGWLRAGMEPSGFAIVDPVLPEAPSGVMLVRDGSELAGRTFDAGLLGIKPQMLGDVAPSLQGLVGAGTVLLSILAGVELDTLARTFPSVSGIVRIMPNLAAAIGKSPIALAAHGLDDLRRADVTALMEPLGTPEWLADEVQFHAVTALAGSGPAFVYRFIDALTVGARELGMERAQAERLALAMVEGAALLAATSADAPGELARKVASPGGTTQAGIDVLDADAALARLVAATLKAAAVRSAEMAEAARG